MLDDTPTKPVFKVGQVIVVKDQKLECSAVSANGDEGKQHHFRYEFILQSEAEALRAANGEHAKIEAANARERKALVKRATGMGVDGTSFERFPTNDFLRNYLDNLQIARDNAKEEVTVNVPEV